MKLPVGALIWLFAMTAALSAQEQRIPILREWTGRITKEQNAQGPRSMVIANAQQWEQLWKAYKLGEELPKIDFTKSLVLYATGDSAHVRFTRVTLNNGDLKVRVFTTDDLRPDYAYHIIQIPRDGIKTVSGKPVEK